MTTTTEVKADRRQPLNATNDVKNKRLWLFKTQPNAEN
jgi:hypothetical protein